MNPVIFNVSDHVASVTINRPERLNAVDEETALQLEDIWCQIEHNQEIRVVVLSGSGDRAFCVGADMSNPTMSGLEYWASRSPKGFGGLALRQSLNVPVIARVNGYALGGGFEMVLGCDIVIASESAQFGLTEPKVGRLPMDGGMTLLPRMTTSCRAMGLLLTGKKISSQEALSYGLINEVVSSEKLDETVERWVHEILDCAPLSVRAIKAFVRKTEHLSPHEAQAQSVPEVMSSVRSEDSEEGVRAFQEKRRPVWQGK